MTKLEWEKRNVEKKGKKPEIINKTEKRKGKDVDYMMRLKSIISDIENKKWNKKRGAEKILKRKQTLYSDLKNYHTKLIKSRATYYDSEMYNRIEKLLIDKGKA